MTKAKSNVVKTEVSMVIPNKIGTYDFTQEVVAVKQVQAHRKELRNKLNNIKMELIDIGNKHDFKLNENTSNSEIRNQVRVYNVTALTEKQKKDKKEANEFFSNFYHLKRHNLGEESMAMFGSTFGADALKKLIALHKAYKYNDSDSINEENSTKEQDRIIALVKEYAMVKVELEESNESTKDAKEILGIFADVSKMQSKA